MIFKKFKEINKMKKIFLLLMLLTYCGFAQTTTTINELNTKTNLDSADYFIIAQATDSANYKIPFDAIVDKIEDSLAKSQIAYKNAYNTFLYPQTLNGFTSGGSSTFNSNATFNGTTTVNGGITFNSRPTFYGALFNAADYGLIRFNDSTYFYYGQTTFYNNPVVFDGNSPITLYGNLNTIAGAKIKIPSAIYSADFTALGYVGSDGSGAVVFDYGSSASNRDTLASRKYVRTNYFDLNYNNTISGNNTYLGTNTYTNTTYFDGITQVRGALVIQIDSVAVTSDGTFYVTSGTGKVVLHNSTGSSKTITTISGGNHGQEITLICGPSSDPIVINNGTNVKLSGGVNFTMDGYDNVTLVNYWGVWIEIARSNN